MPQKRVIIDAESVSKEIKKGLTQADHIGQSALLREWTRRLLDISRGHTDAALCMVVPAAIGEEAPGLTELARLLGVSIVPGDTEAAGAAELARLVRASAQQGPVFLVTGRVLFMQLVCEAITILPVSEPEPIGVDEIVRRVGLAPQMLGEVFALSGDPDSAVEGILSLDMARNVVRDCGGLDGILAGACPRAIASLVEVNKDRILANIPRVDFRGLAIEGVALPGFEAAHPQDDLNGFLIAQKLYEFLPETLREKHRPVTNMGSKSTYIVEVKTEQDARVALGRISSRGRVALWAEDWRDPEYVSLSSEAGLAWVLRLKGDEFARVLIRELLSRPSIKLIGHNTKSMLRWALSQQTPVTSLISDSAIIAYTLNSHASEASLEQLWLQMGEEAFDPLGKMDALRAAGERADITLRVNIQQYTVLAQDPCARGVYEQLELPLIKVLARMEHEGIRVDCELLESLNKRYLGRMEQIRDQIDAQAGASQINLSSPSQIQDLLCNTLGIEQVRGRGTSDEVLEQISTAHPIVNSIREYRAISKLSGSFISALIAHKSPATGRVHTSLVQNVTATGRLASRDPALQNIPNKTEDGRRIRKAFAESDGRVILSADYSQVELRILAHNSKDPSLISAFRTGMDVHAATAAHLAGKCVSDVSDDERRAAKAINFGLIYGLSASGLAKKIGVDRAEAQRHIAMYFEQHPAVKTYLDRTVALAREQGYVQTISGRKLFINGLHSADWAVRSRAERVAQNAPMQGSAADIIKKAMIQISERILAKESQITMLLQVHDELLFALPSARAKELCQGVVDIMQGAYTLDVPLTVDVALGSSWMKEEVVQSIDHDWRP